MRYLFNFLLAANSVMMMISVYLVDQAGWIGGLDEYSIIIYLIAPFIVAWVCLLVSRWLPKDSADGGFVSVELANDSYLPCYLGYFFVALSITCTRTFWVVLIILLIFVMSSQNLYYNPLFLVFGYKFYYVTSNNGMRMFIISKREIKEAVGLKFPDLRRINNFTFIDMEEL